MINFEILMEFVVFELLMGIIKFLSIGQLRYKFLQQPSVVPDGPGNEEIFVFYLWIAIVFVINFINIEVNFHDGCP